jgi:hypothetical protein
MGRRVETPSEPKAQTESDWPIPIRQRLEAWAISQGVAEPLLREHGFTSWHGAAQKAWFEKRLELEVLVEEIDRLGLIAEYETRLAAYQDQLHREGY